METKVRIEKSFHRFVDQGEGKSERKETFAAGQTVTVPETDAADWIAKGLAVELGGSQPASESTPA